MNQLRSAPQKWPSEPQFGENWYRWWKIGCLYITHTVCMVSQPTSPFLSSNLIFQHNVKFDLIETFGLKYVTRFLRSPIATLHSLIQDNHILLDTPKNVPIFLHMQKESKSSQPFVPVQLNGVPLNELDAKQKSSDGIISWWSHFLDIEIHTWIATVKLLVSN